MLSSYQYTGPLETSSISGNFVKGVNPSSSASSVVPAYSSSKQDEIRPDGKNGNLSFGAVAFPKSVSFNSSISCYRSN
jgi:hypothetical protein